MIQDVTVTGPVSTSTLVTTSKVNVVLTGAQTAHEVLAGVSDKFPVIVDCSFSVTQASAVTIFFGDGGDSGDTFVTHYLSAGVPFIWQHRSRNPSGDKGDPIKVTTTAGNLYLNLEVVHDD